MNAQNKKLNIQQELESATCAFRDAKLLLENGSLEGAISRGYYAAFHMAQALLLTLGLEPKTHQGVAYLFSQHFVKSGRIEPHYSHVLARAQKYREEADYGHAMVFTREQVEKTLQEIDGFMKRLDQEIK